MNRWVLAGLLHFAFYAVLLRVPTMNTGEPNIRAAIFGMAVGAIFAVAAWRDKPK